MQINLLSTYDAFGNSLLMVVMIMKFLVYFSTESLILSSVPMLVQPQRNSLTSIATWGGVKVVASVKRNYVEKYMFVDGISLPRVSTW